MPIPSFIGVSSLVRRSGWAAIWIAGIIGVGASESRGADAKSEKVALGHELFVREWVPDDARSHGGDGLGPMYNERSCVACHSLGGTGGAGPADKNVVLVTAVSTRLQARHQTSAARRRHGRTTPAGARTAVATRDKSAEEKGDLIRVHAGFRDSPSVVLHKYGTAENYAERRATIARDVKQAEPLQLKALAHDLFLGNGIVRDAKSASALLELEALATLKPEDLQRMDSHFLTADERNTPPLLGVGLIDALPSRTLAAVAARQAPRFRGRLRHLKGGNVGRFGWKAQSGSLKEFVYAACANELGLEVPGHHQAITPDGPVTPDGLDLNSDECDAIVDYLASLPAPTRIPGSRQDPDVADGARLFNEVGCSVCHTPDLGPAHGIYSDLMLHDMGPALASSGSSYGGSSDSTDAGAPKPQEWKTPPLWGLRDSRPYLHDGRAETLDEAISLHDGQASESNRRYRALDPDDKRTLERFLNSLAAPARTE